MKASELPGRAQNLAPARGAGNKICRNKHQIKPPNTTYSGGCKACAHAFQYARRHKLFYDDPVVLERADRLYNKYMEES